MDGKFERNAASIANALPHPCSQGHVMPVARHEVVARLSDANDGTATLQLLARQAIVEKALEIERRHVWIPGVVPPGLAAQSRGYMLRCHDTLHRTRAEYRRR